MKVGDTIQFSGSFFQILRIRIVKNKRYITCYSNDKGRLQTIEENKNEKRITN